MKTAITVTLIIIANVSFLGAFDKDADKGKNIALVAVAAIFALAIIFIAG